MEEEATLSVLVLEAVAEVDMAGMVGMVVLEEVQQPFM